MKRQIDSDEWYPVYSLREGEAYGGYEVEVTQEQANRWDAAASAFDATQSEMSEIYAAAESAARDRALVAKEEREAKERAERDELNRQRREASEARQKRIEAMIGTVYDSEGNPVGEVRMGTTGLLIQPRGD